MKDKKNLVPRQITDIVTELHDELGLKQEQIAQIMAVRQNRISALESSRRASHYQKHFSMFLRLIEFCQGRNISLWRQQSALEQKGPIPVLDKRKRAISGRE